MTTLGAARKAWFPACPQWVEALARAVDRASRTKVANRLGVSRTAVSRVLSNQYPHDTAGLRDRVVAHLMEASVYCPVLGTLSRQECELWQGRIGATPKPNSQWLHMGRACRGCPVFRGEAA